VSDSVRRFSADVGRLTESKLTVIPNGVDEQRFFRAVPCSLAELGVEPGRRAIVHVGRLDSQKGLDWLLAILPGIFAKLPEHDLVLAGEGPARVSLQDQTARLGLAKRVHFLGIRTDVPEILAASDLLVLPSRWEGMPNAVLEAMAAGKPVVATDVEGVRELLGSDANVQIASSHSAEDFTDKVFALLSDVALARRVGEINQRRAAEHFSLETMTAAYQGLYRALIEARR
jgi:glycosyltransferase involved in cell wall biosynthesis